MANGIYQSFERLVCDLLAATTGVKTWKGLSQSEGKVMFAPVPSHPSIFILLFCLSEVNTPCKPACLCCHPPAMVRQHRHIDCNRCSQKDYCNIASVFELNNDKD